jgi:hypothetical protein
MIANDIKNIPQVARLEPLVETGAEISSGCRKKADAFYRLLTTKLEINK